MGSRRVFETALMLSLITTLTFTVDVRLVSPSARTWIVPTDFPKIQDAINAASTGDTILVRNGTYHENIIVNKTLTLTGENKNATIINGNATLSRPVIIVKSSNVKISGFTVMSDLSEYAVRLDKVTGCQVTGNIMVNDYEGIRLNSSSGNLISGNWISDIWYFYGIHLSDSSGNTVSGNTITSSHHGIYLERSNNNNINHNFVSFNRVGIYVIYSSNDTLSGNTAAANWEYGILLESSKRNTLRNNNMINNTVSHASNFGVWGSSMFDFFQDIDTSNTVNGRPIYYLVNKHNQNIPLDAGYVATVNCTNIGVKNLTLVSNRQGVLFYRTQGSIIQDVNMSANFDGIFLLLSSNNTIRGNRIDDSEDDNFYVSSSDDNIFYHNSLFGSIGHQIVTDSTNQWDNGAEGNYWNDYLGTDKNQDGIGDSPYVIDDYNRDNHPLMKPWPSHVVAITRITPCKTIVGTGYPLSINVTVANQGDFSENMNLTIFANDTAVATGTVVSGGRGFTTITVTWNTIGFTVGNYTISARIHTADTVDSSYIDGKVLVTMPGDVNGDAKVDSFDLFILSKAYGSTSSAPNWNPNCDINGDNKVNFADLLILSENYGNR